jgi:hypothetical protein
VRYPSRDPRAVRAEGRRRVQTVTTWTAGGSLVAAAALAAVLAHGTTAARQNATNDQLQSPDSAPTVTDPGGADVGSGGS